MLCRQVQSPLEDQLRNACCTEAVLFVGQIIWPTYHMRYDFTPPLSPSFCHHLHRFHEADLLPFLSPFLNPCHTCAECRFPPPCPISPYTATFPRKIRSFVDLKLLSVPSISLPRYVFSRTDQNVTLEDLGPDKLSDDFQPEKVSTGAGEEYDHIVVGSDLGGECARPKLAIDALDADGVPGLLDALHFNSAAPY